MVLRVLLMRCWAGMLLLRRRRRLEGVASVIHHICRQTVSRFRVPGSFLTQDHTSTLSASGIKHVITVPGATSRLVLGDTREETRDSCPIAQSTRNIWDREKRINELTETVK